MPANYNVEPVAPQNGNPAQPTGFLQSFWIGTVMAFISQANTGWSGINEAATGDALIIIDDQYNRTPVAQEGLTTHMREIAPVVQASLDGRLFIKKKDSDQLIQLHTPKLEMAQSGEPVCDINFSTPMLRIPGEPVSKPESPSFWKYIVAFFFPSSQSARDIESYNAKLAEYKAYQANLAPKPTESEKAVVEEIVSKPVTTEKEPVEQIASKPVATEKEPVEALESDPVLLRSNPAGAKMENMSIEEFQNTLTEMANRAKDAEYSVSVFHLKPRSAAELRSTMLDCLQCQAARNILQSRQYQENPEQFLQENQTSISNMMYNLKFYVNDLSQGKYQQAIELFSKPNIPLARKIPLSKQMKDFVTLALDDFSLYALEHGSRSDDPEYATKTASNSLENKDNELQQSDHQISDVSPVTGGM